MIELINSVRPYLEALYFVASITLVAGLGLTYRQLLLIKDDIQIKNQRAAAEKAIEACDRYFCSYVPMTTAHLDELMKNKIQWYKGTIGDFSATSISGDGKKDALKRFTLMTWLPAMNQLESIAAFFMSGVADEITGFRVIGRTFCSTVESNYDLIAFGRKEKACAYWSNIVALYQLWRPRLQKEEIELARNELEKQISSMQDKSISPIGVSK